jgi:hypothetical protein
MGQYSQNFIFLVTYEWARQARVLHYTKLERIARANTLAYGAYSYVMKRKNCSEVAPGPDVKILFTP